MAKQVIILGYTQDAQNTNIDCVFWYPASTGQKAQANGSVWAGANAAENTAIQNGSIIEERTPVTLPTGLDVPSMKLHIQAQWNARNTAIGGKGPALFAGVNWDSVSGWSA